MHALIAQFTGRPEWVPLVVLVVAAMALRLRPGPALAAAIGWGIGACGTAALLLCERLAYEVTARPPHSLLAYVGPWRYSIPLLAALALVLAVCIRYRGLRAMTYVDTITGGAAVMLLGVAWSQLHMH